MIKRYYEFRFKKKDIHIRNPFTVFEVKKF